MSLIQDVAPGQLINASLMNAVKASVNSWVADVDANGYSLNNVGTVQAVQFSGSGAGLTTIPISALAAGDYSSKITSGTYEIDITGSAGSVAWANVTGRPTALSAFTNDPGYLTSTWSVNVDAGSRNLSNLGDITFADGKWIRSGINIVLGGSNVRPLILSNITVGGGVYAELNNQRTVWTFGIDNDNGDSFYFYQNGMRVIITPAGSVSIPSGSLTIGPVQSDVAARGQLQIFGFNSSGVGPELFLNNQGGSIGEQERITFSAGGTDRAYILSTLNSVDASGELSFWTGRYDRLASTGTITERMRISGNGFVGIGTSAPAHTLEVNGQIAVFRPLAPDDLSSVVPADSKLLFYDFGSGNWSGMGVNPNGQWWLRTGPSDTAAQVAVFGANGFFGVGTTSPVSKLHVSGGNISVDSGNSFNAITNADTGSSAKLSFEYSRYIALEGWNMVFSVYNPQDFIFKDDQKERLRILSNGNVGIGTSGPAHPLHMGGGAYCSGTTWTNACDIELKTNFQDVDGDDLLGKLASLPIQSWSYRAESPTVRRVGPTAQDWYRTFQLGDSTTAIGTVEEIGVALAACKALFARIKAIEARLAA